MRKFLVLFAFLALLGALPDTSWAQEKTADEQRAEQAEPLDQKARTAYRLGEFDDAISSWKEAFRLSSHPVFLYNIAQSYRRKEEFKSAIFFYKQFLQEDPKAENRSVVESRIAELEKLLVGQKEVKDAQPQEPLATDKAKGAETTPPDEQPKEEAPPSPTTGTTVASAEPPIGAMPQGPAESGPVDHKTSTGGLKLAGMGVGGAGAVLIGVGIVYALKASTAESDVEAARTNNTPWSAELDDRLASGEQAALIGKVTIGLGAAALVGGGVLYFLGTKSANEEREHAGLQITPTISSSDFSVALGLQF